MAGIEIGDDGWFRQLAFDSDAEHTSKKGILIAGACQGPKDIPDSVAQGSAAAAIVLQNVMKNVRPAGHEMSVSEHIVDVPDIV